jgi:hypothetical protein
MKFHKAAIAARRKSILARSRTLLPRLRLDRSKLRNIPNCEIILSLVWI